ncbi:hypothetical protein ACFLZV_07425 [Candidatus Margulisiibacteriota bacterium]
MERMDGHLKDYFKNTSYEIIQKNIKPIIKLLLELLKFLAREKLFNTDLKPENILYKIINEDSLRLALTDFGGVYLLNQAIILLKKAQNNTRSLFPFQHTQAHNNCHVAPELMQFTNPRFDMDTISCNANVFLLGKSLQELLEAKIISGKCEFSADQKYKREDVRTDLSGYIAKEFGQDVADIIRNMTQQNHRNIDAEIISRVLKESGIKNFKRMLNNLIKPMLVINDKKKIGAVIQAVTNAIQAKLLGDLNKNLEENQEEKKEENRKLVEKICKELKLELTNNKEKLLSRSTASTLLKKYFGKKNSGKKR